MHTVRCLKAFLSGVLAALGVMLVLGVVLASLAGEISADESGAVIDSVKTDQSSYGCVEAPVNLPDDVTLTSFYASVYDNDRLFGAGVTLWRVNNVNGVVTALASVGTGRSAAYDGIQVLQTSSIVEPVVSYPAYAYYATICLRSTDIRLYSLRLDVDVPGGNRAEEPVVVPAAAFSSDGFLPLTHHFWFGRGYLEGAYELDLQMVHLPLAMK
jgi:hypothetical protein